MFSRFFHFRFDFLVMWKDGLIRKSRLILNFVKWNLDNKQLHILANISRNKDNQAITIGQLIEYNMRNIFLEKSYGKSGSKPISKTFSKKSKWAYPWTKSFMQLVFIVFQVEDYRSILKLSCRPLAFTSYKASLKNKKRSETSLPASFSEWFLKKIIPIVMLYYLTNFYCLFAFISWDIRQYVYCNCLLTRLWRHKFWNESSKLTFTCSKSPIKTQEKSVKYAQREQ